MRNWICSTSYDSKLNVKKSRQLGIEKIPEHWQVKKLGEVAEYINGRAFKPSEWERTGKPIIRIQNLNNKAAVFNYSNMQFENKYKVENGDLLYAWSASLGVHIWNGDSAWLNQHIFKVIPKCFSDKKYLFYILEKITSELYSKAHGSGMVHVTKSKFETTLIPLPPLPEQQAIVSKIEELFSELENGKQQLQTAQQQLKVYRQSLLKWAFENIEYPIFNMVDVNFKIQIGPFGTQLHKEDYIENGIPLINPMHIQNGKIVPNYSYSIREEKMKSLPNYILKEGDVIMGRRGEMGRCGLVSKSEDGWFCGTGSLYFRPNPTKVNSRFLYYYLSSQPIKKHLELNAGGTTMANLNLKIVKEIPIKLPEIGEQTLIVNELESKLTICDKIEETISQSLQQADTLRQSILKRAFDGKLITAEKMTVENELP